MDGQSDCDSFFVALLLFPGLGKSKKEPHTGPRRHQLKFTKPLAGPCVSGCDLSLPLEFFSSSVMHVLKCEGEIHTKSASVSVTVTTLTTLFFLSYTRYPSASGSMSLGVHGPWSNLK